MAGDDCTTKILISLHLIDTVRRRFILAVIIRSTTLAIAIFLSSVTGSFIAVSVSFTIPVSITIFLPIRPFAVLIFIFTVAVSTVSILVFSLLLLLTVLLTVLLSILLPIFLAIFLAIFITTFSIPIPIFSTTLSRAISVPISVATINLDRSSLFWRHSFPSSAPAAKANRKPIRNCSSALDIYHDTATINSFAVRLLIGGFEVALVFILDEGV